MRDIDERQLRRLAGRCQYFRGASADPLAARQARHRTPKRGKRKRAEFVLQFVAKAIGIGKDVKRLVAIGAVVRFGRDADVNGRALVEPPEEFRATKRLAALYRPPSRRGIERLGLEQPVGLLPKADFHGVAIQPAVAD